MKRIKFKLSTDTARTTRVMAEVSVRVAMNRLKDLHPGAEIDIISEEEI